MKKICLALLALIALCACDETGNTPDIFGYDPGMLNQVYYANQSGAVATFRFATAKNWDATVSFPSGNEVPGAEKWLTVTPDHGDGGTVAMRIILSANETGAVRTAQVKITCGSAVLPLLITQKADTGDDPGPLPSDVRWLVEKIAIRYDNAPNENAVIRFTYDAQNRLIKAETYDAAVLEETIAYAYRNGSITETWTDSPSDTETNLYVLDAAGRIVSWEETGYDHDGGPRTGSGRLEYDGDRLVAAFTIDDGIESSGKLYWENGNMTKITYTTANEEFGTEMNYGSEPNNTTVNLDLNYIICCSEWMSNLAFDSFMVKATGYVGARSAKMLASEKDFGSKAMSQVITYRYTTDSRGLITRVEINDPGPHDTYQDVYEITYREIR